MESSSQLFSAVTELCCRKLFAPSYGSDKVGARGLPNMLQANESTPLSGVTLHNRFCTIRLHKELRRVHLQRLIFRRLTKGSESAFSVQ